jgi:hypothetical protein
VVEREHAYRDEFFAEKETNGNASFTLDVHPAKGTYDLSVRFFPVDITGERSVWSKGAHGSIGTCINKPPIETSDTRILTVRMNAEGHYISGEKIKPGSSNFLEGSEVGQPPEANESVKIGNVSYNKTYGIQFRWMLWRLPTR